MRRFLSGLALALVALGTVTGQANAATGDPTTDALIQTVEGSHFVALGRIDGYFMGVRDDGRYVQMAPLWLALRRCGSVRATDCITHAVHRHDYLRQTLATRSAAWMALTSVLPQCTDQGSTPITDDCLVWGATHKYFILDGRNYFYKLG